MGQKKLQRFEEIRVFSNVFEHPLHMAGAWGNYFRNDNPITLELACGKGEYALGLGRLYPDQNFIGIDIKGNRIWVGARQALEENRRNVAFLRARIDQITQYFVPGEVSNIWITFPDPQPRFSKAKKRLTHPQFLRRYQEVLKPNGLIHLKTDSPDLYEFTKLVIELYELEIVEDFDDIYRQEEIHPDLRIKTHYEGLDIAGSRRVHYLCFRVNKPMPIEKDHLLKAMLLAKMQKEEEI